MIPKQSLYSKIILGLTPSDADFAEVVAATGMDKKTNSAASKLSIHERPLSWLFQFNTVSTDSRNPSNLKD